VGLKAFAALSVLVALKDQLSGPALKVMGKAKDLDKTLSTLGKTREISLKGVAMGTAGVASGIAALSGLKGAMAPVYEFEDSMALIGTVAPKDMQAMSAAAKSWAGAHTDSASQFAKAGYLMLSSGLDMQASIAGTRTALTVAKATMGDAAETASLLGTVYANMGDKTRPVEAEMGRLGDVLTKTQQLFKFPNLGVLTEGLKYGVPVAKQYGIGMEQLASAIGTLNDAGIEGGMAGTTLSAMMRQMQKASKSLGFEIARTADGGVDFIGTIARIQAQFGDKMKLPEVQQAFQDAFGDEGVKGVTLLMGKVGRMRGALGELAGATGSAAKAQAALEATGSAGWARLSNAVDLLKIELGQSLGPALASVADSLRGAAVWLKEFATSHPRLAKVGMWIAALAPIAITLVGALAVLVGSLVWTFTWPLTGIVKFRQQLALLRGNGFGSLGKAVRAAGTFFKGLGGALANVGRGILGLLPSLWGLIVSIGTGLWGAIVSATTAVWGFTVALLSNPLTWIVVGIAAVIAGIVALVYYWDVVKAAVVSAGAAIWSAVTGVFTAIWERIVGFGSLMYNAGASLFSAFIDGVKSMASAVWDSVTQVFGWIGKLLPHSDAKAGPLSRLTASGRSFGTTWARGIRAGIPAIRSAVAGATAAAAIAVAPVELPGATGVAEYVASSVRAPEVPSMGSVLASERQAAVGAGGKGARPIQIGKLSLTVEGATVQQQEQLVKMIRGLADQHA
jgi:TP901 family phage tail tape measure protein